MKLEMMNRFRNRQPHRQGGFTLMEASFAIMIIGFGIVAMMQVFVSGTEVNAFGDDLSKAVFLAEEIRAMTDNTSFGSLEATYDGQTYAGVDANNIAVPGLATFQQAVTVQGINPSTMALYVGADPQTYRLTVTVSRDGEQLTRLSWLRSE